MADGAGRAVVGQPEAVARLRRLEADLMAVRNRLQAIAPQAEAGDPDRQYERADLHRRRDALLAEVQAIVIPTSAWDAELARLFTAAETAEAELAAVVRERRRIAPAAVNGEPEAGEKLAALNLRHGELLTALDRLRDAACEASERRREAAEAEQRAAHDAADYLQRKAKARQVAEHRLAAARRADEALAALAKAAQEMKACAAELRTLGFGHARHFMIAPAMTRAAHAAGLRGALEIPPTPAGPHVQPMAEQDAPLLRHLLPDRAARPAAVETPAEATA